MINFKTPGDINAAVSALQYLGVWEKLRQACLTKGMNVGQIDTYRREIAEKVKSCRAIITNPSSAVDLRAEMVRSGVTTIEGIWWVNEPADPTKWLYQKSYTLPEDKITSKEEFDWMKWAPLIIGGILLLVMRRR